jgi:carboxymethylenebutenolidase
MDFIPCFDDDMRTKALLQVQFILLMSIVGSIGFLPIITNTAAVTAYAQPSNSTALSSLSPNKNSNNVENKTVNYYDRSSGYLATPFSTGALANNNNSRDETNTKLPAIVMIHENRGLNNNIKNMANTLAKEGYVVLAVDLFNGQVATTSEQARQLSSSVRNNPSIAIANLQSAVKYLSSLENVNASRIASLGWCFGGGQSLQLALHSEEQQKQQQPLAATILYYGTPLVTDKGELSKIKWPVLGIFGDHDQAIPLQEIEKFKAALNADGITNEIYIYKGLGHAFANPSGDNYAPKETEDAWHKTLAFLKKYV